MQAIAADRNSLDLFFNVTAAGNAEDKQRCAAFQITRAEVGSSAIVTARAMPQGKCGR